MPEAVIVDAIRTPIGRALKGSLKDVRADELAAVPLKALAGAQPRRRLLRDRRRHDGRRVHEREQGYNVGRNAALLGRDRPSRPRRARSTASAPRRCRRCAWPSTRSRPARATSTSPRGVEAVSRAGPARACPTSSSTRSSTAREGSLVRRLHPDGPDRRERGRALQRVARGRRTSGRSISQNRAVDAQASGHFDKEIVAVTHAGRHRGRQGRRPAARARRWRSSRRCSPAFKEDGTVTAGNACPLNDGAAAVLVMCDEKAEALGLKPRARIVASTVAAIRPEIMGLGPIPAIQGCSSRPA